MSRNNRKPGNNRRAQNSKGSNPVMARAMLEKRFGNAAGFHTPANAYKRRAKNDRDYRRMMDND